MIDRPFGSNLMLQACECCHWIKLLLGVRSWGVAFLNIEYLFQCLLIHDHRLLGSLLLLRGAVLRDMQLLLSNLKAIKQLSRGTCCKEAVKYTLGSCTSYHNLCCLICETWLDSLHRVVGGQADNQCVTPYLSLLLAQEQGHPFLALIVNVLCNLSIKNGIVDATDSLCGSVLLQ